MMINGNKIITRQSVETYQLREQVDLKKFST